MEIPLKIHTTKNSKIPSFDGMKQSEEDKNQLLMYARNPQGFLLISGSNGSGKSYAAEAIYNLNTPFRLPEYDSEKALFINQSQLNLDYIQSFQNQQFMIEKYQNTRLLVLDDIGTRKPSDGFMDFLYLIVDSRWINREEKGTIITTNRNSREIREMFGDSFLSRVASGIIKRWDHDDRRSYDF